MIKTFIILVSVLYQSKAQLAEWNIPCGAIYNPPNCENASIENLKTIEEYELCAPARLEPGARDYVWSAAVSQKTFFENKEAFKRIWIKRKVLRGIGSNYSLETTVFGRKIAFPLGIAPTVGHVFYHPDGEIGTARAAASTGTVMILDSYSTTLLVDVASSVPPGSELWMHTYILPKLWLMVDFVRRAERAGFKAIVVTVDEPYFFDIRCDAIAQFEQKYTKMYTPNILHSDSKLPTFPNDTELDQTATFSSITWLTTITHLPIVAKGILSGDDAVQAAKAGASAIYVSNQGGRQLDGALPTIDVLSEVVTALKEASQEVEVFVDGGVRYGVDVFKALARGADMVFIGRPAIWGLAMGGEKGVEKVLTILRDEFKNAMIHAGFSDPRQITRNSIVSKWNYDDYPLINA